MLEPFPYGKPSLHLDTLAHCYSLCAVQALTTRT